MERPSGCVAGVMDTEGVVVGSKVESMVVVFRVCVWVAVFTGVEGWNSLARGLKEKRRGDDIGERGLWKGDGGGARVEERDMGVEREVVVVVGGRGSGVDGFSSPLNPRCTLPALLPPPSLSIPGGKYDTNPLNFKTSALALTNPQQPSISAY